MKYDFILLDSAIFKKPLSKRATDLIISNKTIVSKAFFVEVKAYLNVLDQKRKDVLAQNLAKIISAIKGSNDHISAGKNPFDIFVHACDLASKGHKVCVMTEDISLIERIQLSRKAIDIFNLNDNNLLSHHFCNSISSQVFIDRSNNAERIRDIKKGTKLYTENGKELTLDDKLDSSGCTLEGNIFNVKGKSDILVKIYKKYPSSQKCEHLKKLTLLNKELNLDWCILPEDLVYCQNRVVGFTMRRLHSDKLSDDSLFLGNDANIDKEKLALNRSYIFRFCHSVLSQLKVLSCYGIKVSDYNDGNFSEYSDGCPVIFYDTDSFVYDRFFPNTIDDKAFSKKYGIKNKEELSKLCDEGTHKFVFRLLSLGAMPFINKDLPFRFLAENDPVEYRKAYFSNLVLSDMYKVFSSISEPSVSKLLCDVALSIEELKADPAKDVTINQMIDDALSGAGPFPVNASVKVSQKNNTAVKENTKELTPAPVRKKKGRFFVWAASIAILLSGMAWLLQYLIAQNYIPW